MPSFQAESRVAVAVLISGVVCGSAMAQELVLNGGFETGNFSGWFVPPNVPPGNPNSAHYRVATAGGAHEGDFWAGLSSANLQFISQVLPTQAGEDYELSFWLRRPESIAGRFVIRWEGQTIYDNFLLQLPDGDNWHRLSFPLHANITGSFLEFGQRTYPLEWHIDDVSVMTPAPSAAPLLLLGSAVVMRRLRR